MSSKTRDFDPEDEVSYYYGNLNRDHVKEILADASIGTFLIRDSTKDFDQKVLCVKEAHETINSYKIMRSGKAEEAQATGDSDSESPYSYFIYGKEDCLFPSIPKILEFYSTHYLNQSPLVKPAFHHKKVIAMFDFQESGDPSEDLYFFKNDILTVLEYTQGEHWWNACINGKTGLIPATLVRRLKPNEPYKEGDKQDSQSNVLAENVNTTVQVDNRVDEGAMKCPFDARVIEDYTPSPYEKSHIPLKKGQLVTVLEMKSIGKWFGQTYASEDKTELAKKGLFPFNRVQIV